MLAACPRCDGQLRRNYGVLICLHCGHEPRVVAQTAYDSPPAAICPPSGVEPIKTAQLRLFALEEVV